MNTKNNQLSSFHVYDKSLELAKALHPILRPIREYSADIGKQLERAAVSVPLNIAEGVGRQGKDRHYHYSVALGSAREVGACLDIACAFGIIRRDEKRRELLDSVCAMLWRLRRPV